jgi:hypothetical protein
LSDLLKRYRPYDLFNADKTVIIYYYLRMPDKTLKFKNEKYSGGKLSKERLTLLLSVNMTVTNKMKNVL